MVNESIEDCLRGSTLYAPFFLVHCSVFPSNDLERAARLDRVMSWMNCGLSASGVVVVDMEEPVAAIISDRAFATGIAKRLHCRRQQLHCTGSPTPYVLVNLCVVAVCFSDLCY